MATSARLSLPLLEAGQTQKHVTVNEALNVLDGVTHITLHSVGATVPPTNPALLETHMVGAGATGEWVGQDNSIAINTAGGWRFVTPQPGWIAYDVTEMELVAFDGSGWVPLNQMNATLNNLDQVGIAATADSTNKLSVASDAVLLSHGATGDHRLKVNRQSPSDTAALLFQSGFAGVAELGLLGTTDLAVKVSNDNFVTAHTAIGVDSTTGRVAMGEGVSIGPVAAPSAPLHVQADVGSQARGVLIDGEGDVDDLPLEVRGAGLLSVLQVRGDGNVLNVNNSYGALSDERLKTDITDAQSQWDDVKALRLRKYRLNGAPAALQLGLVAQEAEAISPGLVETGPDGFKSIKYSILNLKLFGALQEAMTRIERLETQLGDVTDER